MVIRLLKGYMFFIIGLMLLYTLRTSILRCSGFWAASGSTMGTSSPAK